MNERDDQSTNAHCGQGEQAPTDAILDCLDQVQFRLRRLTVVVVFLAFTVVLCATAVFGDLVNYFGSDVLMAGAATAVAAVLGFCFGWFARGKK